MNLELILQTILLTADKPLSFEQLETYFPPEALISRAAIRATLKPMCYTASQHFADSRS